MLAIPLSQQPWMIVISDRLVGPRIATWSPGTSPRLQRRADGSCVVVDLGPSEVAAGRRLHGRSDEPHPGRPVGRLLQAVDDRSGLCHVRRR